MKLPIYQIDAFASAVFSGNPAAVCPLECWLPEATMQSIAAENNLAETAFFVPRAPGPGGEVEYDLRALRPSFEGIRALGVHGVIVTAPGSDVDFVSRFFAPLQGVPEDPVTGSAHCTLVPYWAKRLGRTRLRARQISARGGELACEHRGERVIIAGRAVKYLEGTIEI